MYVPTSESLNEGEPFHIKYLKTGTILVVRPKQNKA